MRQMFLSFLFCGAMLAQVPFQSSQSSSQSSQSPLLGPQKLSGAGIQEPAGVGTQAEPQLRPNYTLRPGDQILIRAFEMEEIGDRPYRIDGDGSVDLPILGRVQAGGLTVDKLEVSLIDLLKKYVKQPQVTVTVVQYSSDLVFFVGAFKAPGIYPLSGERTLEEMMASIGGLQPTASRRVKVTRRKEYGAIPLANAIPAPDGSGTSVEINLASLQDNVNPAEDIVLKPFDVVGVERAEMVYVTGDVQHVGAFELQDRESISVIQALTLAGGLAPTADQKNIRILRPVANSSLRAEIPLDMQKILKGEDNDTPLLPNDVLYVPHGRKITGKDLIVLVPLASTILYLTLNLIR